MMHSHVRTENNLLFTVLQNLLNTQYVFGYHKCPYCRQKHRNFIPFYENNLNVSYLNYKSKHFKKNDYSTCNYIYKSGKRKGCPCSSNANKFLDGVFCNKHKINKKTQPICHQILKNGNQCKNKQCKDFETNLCKRHYNLSLK